MSKDTIYREDAIKAINARSDWYQVTCNGKQIAVMLMAKDVNKILEDLPSADRPQGEWIKTTPWSYGAGMGEVYGYYQKCSNCGKEFMDKSNFCPKCGARMKGTDNE